MGLLGFISKRGRWLARRVTLAAGLSALVVVCASSGMGPRVSGKTAPTTPNRVEDVAAMPTLAPSPSPGPSSTPEVAATEPPAGDIATALESRPTWLTYASSTYHFRINYPKGWYASENQIQGWAVISGWDDSNVSITWRTIPTGTTLSNISDEVWKAMHDNNFTVIDSDPGVIFGLPARIMTVDGVSSLGHARHGIVGIVVTATGRYRVELWTRPGSEQNDVTLFNSLLWTFAIA
ncbi:MAG TPA: hypothetical protein VF337_06135 [Candidatus Limnocylindrales bacterium]